MAKDSWNSGPPDLTKLPKHIRDALDAPIPIQSYEVSTALHMFKDVRGVGANVPNARVRTLVWRGEGWLPGEAPKVAPRLQIDIVDSRGKIPLLTTLYTQEEAEKLLFQIARAYITLSGVSTNILDEIKAKLEGPKDAFDENKYSAVEDKDD